MKGLDQFGTIKPKCWIGLDWMGWIGWVGLDGISLNSLTTRSPYGDNNVPRCLTCKYTNTNTQIHKYSFGQSCRSLNMCYIFVMVMVRGPQKQCSRVSDMQIHKYNYTNTQIQFGSNLQIDLTCAIFLKGHGTYEDLKNNVPDCLTSN